MYNRQGVGRRGRVRGVKHMRESEKANEWGRARRGGIVGSVSTHCAVQQLANCLCKKGRNDTPAPLPLCSTQVAHATRFCKLDIGNGINKVG